MQETQGINGTFGLPAFDERTLSESDVVAVRALYGSCENLGAVNGKVLNSLQGRLAPAAGARVWIEALDSGRVIASSLVGPGGKFNIGCLPAGEYRAMVENGEVGDASAEEGFLLDGCFCHESSLAQWREPPHGYCRSVTDMPAA